MIRLPIEPLSPIILPILISGETASREVDGLLDCGASYLVVATEDAEALGYDLQMAPAVRAVTANGVVEAPFVVLRSVSIGPFEVRNVGAMCRNVSGDRISALIGLNLLWRFRLTLDPAKREMTIRPC